MYKKNTHKQIFAFGLILMISIVLSSCASQAYSQTPVSEPTNTPAFSTPEIMPTDNPASEPTEVSLEFKTYADARDIAVTSLLQRYALEAPGDWETEDQTPENLLGSAAYRYTSGSWAVMVSAPVVAPEYLTYSVEVDHVTSGLRWLGEVAATGEVREISITEPLKVLSPSDARDAAAAFINATYSWERRGTFTEQSSKPTENAGVLRIYTAGPWVVQVEYLAAAPIVSEYRVTVDHMSLVARWTGVVKADGQILEEEFTTK